MPRVSLPDKETCVHRGVHPKWHGREGTWVVCQMSLPYLKNSIKLLETSLDHLYTPTTAKYHFTDMIKQTEDALEMLRTELKRRRNK